MTQTQQKDRAIAQEVVGLEKKYLKAMQEKDLDTALSLTDFPCIVAGPQGARSIDRDAYVEIFNAHRDAAMSFKLKGEPQVRVLGADTAVVAYQCHAVMEKDGKKIEHDVVDTSTWIKRDDRWVCALHTEAKAEAQP